MAVVQHEQILRTTSQDRDIDQSRHNSKPTAAPPPRAKRARFRTFVLNRSIWILTAILLGAAAGWTVFRAFLTLVTLD